MSSSLFRPVWIAVLSLFVILAFTAVWRIHEASGKDVPPITYDKFSELLDRGAIRKAVVYLGYDLSEISASSESLATPLKVDVPTSELPKIIKKLMDTKASVEIAKAHRFDFAEFILDFVPYVLMFVFAILFIKGRMKKVST